MNIVPPWTNDFFYRGIVVDRKFLWMIMIVSPIQVPVGRPDLKGQNVDIM